MAIQNFVAGGFYGKLGAMVGQRWRNKRTLRVWTKPANPRTPRQMEVRKNFADCVSWSQIAMQMNFKAPCFANPSIPEWGERVSKSRELQDNGKSGMGLVALFPRGYTPQNILSGLILQSVGSQENAVFACTVTDSSVDRNLCVLVHFPATPSDTESYELFPATLTVGSTNLVEIEGCPRGRIREGTEFLLVSFDDSAHNNVMVYGAVQGYTTPEIVTRDFNLEGWSVTVNQNRVTVQTSEPYLGADGTIDVPVLHAVSAGQFTYETFVNVALLNVNGYYGFSVECSFTELYEFLAFAPGSSVEFTSILCAYGNTRLTARNGSAYVSSSDLTRSIDFEENYNVELSVNSATSTGTWSIPLPANFGAGLATTCTATIETSLQSLTKTVSVTVTSNAQNLEFSCTDPWFANPPGGSDDYIAACAFNAPELLRFRSAQDVKYNATDDVLISFY